MTDRVLHGASLFAERYRIVEPLGQGAMGMVWRVRDERRGRDCAMKLLRPDLDHATDLTRFNRELRATARLDHPHCIRCFEHGIFEDRAYLIMEYVAGGSLRLERWADPAEVVDLGRQLLSGLDHIHGQGIVHRDLKPQNIFVDRGPAGLHARLGDLGIVRVADFHDEGLGITDIMGSLRFVAPETLEHGMAGPRSDLYALGIVLHCLLAGEHPLGRGPAHPRQWLSLHRHGRAYPVERDDVPPSLARLVLRLCARQPEDRYPSAAAAYDALEAVREHWGSRRWSCPPPLLRRPQLSTPAFVGRDYELRRAQEFCAQAREGTEGPCVMFIEGDAGFGKSRLVRELLVEALDQNVRVLAGTCPAEGASPYRPLNELLRALDTHRSDPAAATSTPTTQTVTRRRVHPIPQAAPDDPTARIATINEATPINDPSEPSLRPPEGLSPEDQAVARLRIHERLTAQLADLCATSPVLVVVDDAQWADPPSLQLLMSIARSVAQGRERGQTWRVGLILTHRPVAAGSRLDEFRETTRAHDNREALRLDPLSAGAATALVASMLRVPAHEIPEAFAAPLLATAEGSPLFLSQMMRLLLSKGTLGVDERGRWQLDAQQLDAASLPASVSSAIGERAARLAISSKQLLATAAVVGRTFDMDIVAAIAQGDELVRLDSLDELVRNEFIEDCAGGHRFVHDRIRESVYDNLSPEHRRNLHRAAAHALRERDQHNPASWPGIAHHFARAEQPERAYNYAIKAADHASTEHAHGTAEQMYELALQMAERSGSIEVDSLVWERCADARAAVGHYAAAVEDYQRRLAQTRSVVESKTVLAKLGSLEYRRGHYEDAVAAAEQVLELTGFDPPRTSSAVRWRTLGQLALTLLPARRWAGSYEDGEARVRSFSLAADTWYLAGRHVRAVYYAVLSANAARGLGPSPSSVRALGGFSLSSTMFGLRRVAEHYLNLAREFSTHVKVPPNDACHLDMMHVLYLVAQGRCEHALAMFGDMSRRYDQSPNAEARLLCLTPQALVMIACGRFARADRALVRQQNLAAETKDVRGQGWAAEIEGQLALRRGHTERGLALMAAAAERCAAHDDNMTLSSINDTRSMFLAFEGRFDEALECGQQAGRNTLEGGLRHYSPVDGGLVVAAALAKHDGHPLDPSVTRLVGRILRVRRWVVGPSQLLRIRFDVGRAAWRAVQGRSADFVEIADRAEALGFLGEAWIVCQVAARLDPPQRERHHAMAARLRAMFEDEP